jgi:hypothetical protein
MIFHFNIGELCDEKLYALKKLYKVKVPTDWSQKADVLSLGVLMVRIKGLFLPILMAFFLIK